MARRIWKRLPANHYKQEWDRRRDSWQTRAYTERPMTVKRWKNSRELRLHYWHDHVPRWFCEEFYIRPERTRCKQLLATGQYERAEIEAQRSHRHSAAYHWA